MTALYWCLGIGGGLVLLAIKFWPSEDEDSERAVRIQREYHVPAEAVSEPTGRRSPRKDWPEITSRYRDEPSR